MQTSNETSYELPDLSHSMGEHLGIVFQEMKDGYVKASMPVDERSCQPFGVLNGGASLALNQNGQLVSTARVVNKIVKKHS